MPVIKDDRDDSDGDGEMEHDSGDSDKSCSTSDSSDGASDSDESSEIGGEECDRRRDLIMEDLSDMERAFTLLREKLYQERVTEVNRKLVEVRMGKAPEYLQRLQELQDNMKIRTEVAGILRQFRISNIRNNYEAEELAARQNYESEKRLVWDSIKDDLDDKIHRLEEDRNSVDINADLWMSEVQGRPWRHGGPKTRADLLRQRKPSTVSGPYIVYMLSDSDILEDWAAIKKALSVCKRKSECKQLTEFKRYS